MDVGSDSVNPYSSFVFTIPPLSDAKTKLVDHIKRNPGIRYKELQRLTGLSNGVLSYHLATLEKANVITVERQTRTTRIYPINFSERESSVLKHLRNKPERQIMIVLLKHDMMTFNELVEVTGKAPSTVSSHMKRLKEDGLVHVRHGENVSLYSITNKDVIADLLSKYRESFADMVVDNFTGIIDEL